MRTMHIKHTQGMDARGEHVPPLQSRLVIDQKDPCVACSPDNLFCFQVVKLAWWSTSTKDCLTPEQAAATLKGFCLVMNSKGKQELKQTHSYQVQESLSITCKIW